KLQGELDHRKAQLAEETAKRDRARAQTALLNAIFLMIGSMEQLTAPDATPAEDEAALSAIADQIDAIQSL
ncbi:hypothetical protein MNEG_16395, partial [Monoraphidium neglectum]